MSWRRETGERALDLLRAGIGVCWLLIALMGSAFVTWFTYRALLIAKDYVERYWF